jgi:putative restriction endonuclease
VPAGFSPDVLATFDQEPELIDVVALHLLDRHFAPGLHEEILEAVGLELGTPVAARRRDVAFRAAVLEAYLAECCVCGWRDGAPAGSNARAALARNRSRH